MSGLSDAYLRSVARSIKVPAMWVDDCIQEIRIAEWREQCPNAKQMARRRAVDFLRKLMGETGGSGAHVLRVQPAPFSQVAAQVGIDESTLLEHMEITAPAIPSEDMLDTEQSLARASERDRRMIGLLAAGYSQHEIARLYSLSDKRVSECIARVRRALERAA